MHFSILSDLKKTTVVVESLSTIQPDVLFQRLPAYFKKIWMIVKMICQRHLIKTVKCLVLKWHLGTVQLSEVLCPAFELVRPFKQGMSIHIFQLYCWMRSWIQGMFQSHMHTSYVPSIIAGLYFMAYVFQGYPLCLHCDRLHKGTLDS